MPPTEFQTLRDFRIIEKVGQGGMGAVYKAVHQRMQRTVALKVLPSGMIGDQSASGSIQSRNVRIGATQSSEYRAGL